MVFQLVSLTTHSRIFSAINYSKVFYRLQVKHADGSFTYSDVRVFTYGNIHNDYSVFPNPAKRHVQIYVYDFTLPVAMVIYDNAGEKIKEEMLSQQTTTIDLPAAKGIYIIQVSSRNGSDKVRKKLVVQ